MVNYIIYQNNLSIKIKNKNHSKHNKKMNNMKIDK